MPGFSNATSVTMENITKLFNSSSLEQFLVYHNQMIFQGWFWFAILLTLGVIMFIAAQKIGDEPLKNAMYACAILTVLSLILRAVYIDVLGVQYGLLTDHQLWIFPIVTIILVGVLWSTKTNY